jgi:hypothetical protein
MNSRSVSLRRLSPSLLTAALLAQLGACAQVETESPITVSTAGAHSVLVGTTVALTATTAEGTDSGYTWSSEDTDIATVDGNGVVTGVASGETTITATGVDTGAVGEHAMVVIDPFPVADGGPDSGMEGGTDPTAVPYYAAWAGSPHADVTAEAFTHWDGEGEVPAECARCHSADGFVDFLGGDGTAPDRVDGPGELGSVVGCTSCHDAAASALTSVTFASGKTVTGLGAEARCMVCHQGRASGLDVDTQILESGVADDDTPSTELGFTNIHYYPAAATLFAGQAQGGYQYEGNTYDTRFRHVPNFDKCNECHDPHTTRVRFNECATCHAGATDALEARNIRQIASRNRDYDGDGNTTEGIYYEVQGLAAKLLASIQRYGAENADRICYGTSYPYWFKDTDADGSCNAAESAFGNGYTRWTPRLQKAAYNFQMAKVDPGSFAHNAKYIIQLLHDSVNDMNGGLAVPYDTSALEREDPGHFNGASPAARNWDANETVQASCSRCHSGSQGFRFFVQYGVGMTVPETDNGLDCATCHENFGATYDVFAPAKTWLPDGKTAVLPGNDSLCANCHIGRASKATIDAAIAAGGALKFINVHYLPAAGTREGTLTKIGYEYDGKTYAGRLAHTGGLQCTSCHDAAQTNHTFEVNDVWDQRCETCHADASQPSDIRTVHLADYDGDGNTTETLKAEVDGMAARLLVAMRAASANGICYDAHTHPYFFKDTDTNGTCSAGEAVSANAYAPFTPALLKASHNYQLSKKEPGAWVHNFNYIGQLLYDSVENVTGAPPANLTRP